MKEKFNENDFLSYEPAAIGASKFLTKTNYWNTKKKFEEKFDVPFPMSSVIFWLITKKQVAHTTNMHRTHETHVLNKCSYTYTYGLTVSSSITF